MDHAIRRFVMLHTRWRRPSASRATRAASTFFPTCLRAAPWGMGLAAMFMVNITTSRLIRKLENKQAAFSGPGFSPPLHQPSAGNRIRMEPRWPGISKLEATFIEENGGSGGGRCPRDRSSSASINLAPCTMFAICHKEWRVFGA